MLNCYNGSIITKRAKCKRFYTFISEKANKVSKGDKKEAYMAEFTLPHQHGKSRNINHLYEELSKISRFNVASEIFKQLGDTTRIRIFWLLSHREECVINIAALMNMSSPAVSHHLRPLKDCGLVVSRRDGKEVYYKTADTEESKLLHKIVEQVMEVACPERIVDYGGTQEEVIHRVHEYLVEHISEKITIEELSKRFLMNTTTLKQAFKAVYGNSVAAHIKEHKMDMASKMLTEGNESISVIASAVGYESQSRFTSAFKDTYGILPTEYRKAKKK